MSVFPLCFRSIEYAKATTVDLAVDQARLVLEPKPRPRYTMAALMAASDYSQLQPAEEREWIDLPPVAGELL